jgi:hypothetical protein
MARRERVIGGIDTRIGRSVGFGDKGNIVLTSGELEARN